ncbi:gamma-glutamyltransferase [uncultured Spongiibacter sp.]|uniref:gamma-glutamyltransferase n=1 Tax=uncultured Spongiibacter sp. TaxID=870896 RepID=UPI0025997E5D|nr:gamma-glutamyltransferase [uncultured Spongiibacter sp.]
MSPLDKIVRPPLGLRYTGPRRAFPTAVLEDKLLKAHKTLLTLLWLCLGTFAHASDPLIVPEAASGFGQIKSARYQTAMAVTANPHASDAAKWVLQKGGSAVDAAIAAQLVLGLVEPQSSGIGGGAFMLHWQAQRGVLESWDGRETAPATANDTYFLQADGTPMRFFDAVIGGRSVGVPGVLAMLESAHRAHGKLPWATLFEPAIRLAKQGFAVSERLHILLERMPKVAVNPYIQRYFFTRADGRWQPKPVGHVLKNPAYAATLGRIQKHGSEDFYRGKLAQAIVDAVRNDPNSAGELTLQDMANYRAIKRDALCAPFREYSVCGAPPPSSGATTVLAILGMLDAYEQRMGLRADWQHGFIEASRLAFADRNHYVGDPAFVEVPSQAMVDSDYLRQRATLIDNAAVLADVKPGNPAAAPKRRSASSPELPSTTHFSIVDRWGNVVSMTSSIETAFGSRVMVGGFLLNNQLTDFSFSPLSNDGALVANRVAAGKRPRSSMAPTIVFKNQQPVLALGSPGGARIIDYVAASLYRILALNMPVGEAIAEGHIIAMGRGVEMESGKADPATVARMRGRGHPVTLRDQTSGLHVIHITEQGLLGGADPRREGSIAGF